MTTIEKLIDALIQFRARIYYGLPEPKCNCRICKDLREVDKLHDKYESEKAIDEQVTAEICDDCGWKMKFPGEECCYCGYDRLSKLLEAEKDGMVWADGNEMSVAVYCADKYGARQALEKTAIIMDYLTGKEE